jgi:ATP-dependent HslUV protease ATP-binding subunit HslU
VELNSLTKENFVEILTKPNNALVKQYKALLGTERLEVEFEEEAIHEIADIAVYMNEHMENIGARRLYTVMENLFEEISFEAPELESSKLKIDKQFVKDTLLEGIKKKDFNQYII